MSASTPESRVKRKVSAMLKRHEVFYFMPGNNGFGQSGMPDYVCCVGGRFIGIECKADATKKPTALQDACADRIAAAGGRWLLVYDDETLNVAEAIIVACKKIL